MLRAICGIALLFAANMPLRAEDAKPNTLTPKEIEEGWILLFDGETSFGWVAKDLSEWSIYEGTLSSKTADKNPLMTSTEWESYELAFHYKGSESGDVKIGTKQDSSDQGAGASIPLLGTNGAWTKVIVRVEQGRFKASFTDDGPKKVTSTLQGNNKVERGAITLHGKAGLFRDIKLKPFGTKTLFNAKDLTGWKKFETDSAKAKSEFTVTKDACIHLKNGPGDLQTEGQYKDFILQAECFCNGDRLNSGIFFRCLPDQYQQGYEAQIHNGFTEKPEKEYAIEEYDSETHKLMGTKKVKYAAIDYGTGGIYRRVPARRSVAKDKEWFTMTVVAHGRHIATWVNGIQVVDWTDNRPENDNARNGCKLGKGAISLQGHDATTDLSFRNIRIAELPLGDKK